MFHVVGGAVDELKVLVAPNLEPPPYAGVF
jgi:hypothetical protein